MTRKVYKRYYSAPLLLIYDNRDRVKYVDLILPPTERINAFPANQAIFGLVLLKRRAGDRPTYEIFHHFAMTDANADCEKYHCLYHILKNY